MALGKRMLKGVVWSAVDRLSMQAVQFILGIVLANLITPKEYGVFSILLVFLAISLVFVDSGFASALIQRKNRTKEDISTMFVFNLGVSLLFFVLLWFAAPFIASFYEIAELTNMLRVLSIGLILQGLYTVPNTLFVIDLDFKTLAKINFSATLIAGGIAIYLAYIGYGVWSLVYQSIIRLSLTLVLTFAFSKWKPSVKFSMASLKSLFAYGFNLLISSILHRGAEDLSALFIGKIYKTEQLGLYTRGAQFSGYASASIVSILNRVLLSGLSKIQDDYAQLKQKNNQILKVTTLASAPLFFGLFALSEPLILLLIGEEWLGAVPFMQVFCVGRLISILCAINLNLLYVVGRTDLVLRQQYLTIAVRVLFIIIGLQFGILYVALGEMLATMIHFFINSYFPSKVIAFSIRKQLVGILPFFVISIVMAVLIIQTNTWIDGPILQLILGTLLGAIFYMGSLYLFRRKDIDLFMETVKKFKSS